MNPTPNIPGIVERLRKSYESGMTRPIEYRIQQLRQLHKMMVQEEDLFAEALLKDLGKCKQEALLTEIAMIANGVAHMVDNIYEFAEPKSVDKPVMFLGETCEIRQVPLGVVLIISAWNYPVQLSLAPLIGAIAGGNTCVLKMSEISPHTAVLMSQLIPQYLDPECVQVVLGAIPESTILLQQPFDFICYTGNTQVGKIVHQAAAKNLTPVLLELGGKSPCIVDGTIDPAIAAKRIAWGKIINAGQTCIAPDYVLIDKKVSKTFMSELEKAFTEILSGPAEKSRHYGRIVSERHFDRLTKMLTQELKVPGSIKMFGGSVRKDDRFIEPTIIHLADSDVANHPILQEEIFGPLLPIIEYNTIDEAIDIAKKIYPTPLSVYPFSTNTKVIETIFQKINAGHALANDTIVNAAVEDLPFGGVSQSGLGSYHGIYSFKTFTRAQSVVIRNGKWEFQNLIRYQNISGDHDSFAFKLIKKVVYHPMRSNFYLKTRRLFKKFHMFQLITYIAVFFVGRWLGNKF